MWNRVLANKTINGKKLLGNDFAFDLTNFLQSFAWNFRWVKFQEDVEDGGKRWSKPFVPAIPLSAISDVKDCLRDGIVAFDVAGYNINDILGKKLNFFPPCWCTKMFWHTILRNQTIFVESTHTVDFASVKM